MTFSLTVGLATLQIGQNQCSCGGIIHDDVCSVCNTWFFGGVIRIPSFIQRVFSGEHVEPAVVQKCGCGCGFPVGYCDHLRPADFPDDPLD